MVDGSFHMVSASADAEALGSGPWFASLRLCVDSIAAGRTDSSGKHTQHYLSALSALFHLFKCIPYSADRQDSSGKQPQTFLRALGDLCELCSENCLAACIMLICAVMCKE